MGFTDLHGYYDGPMMGDDLGPAHLFLPCKVDRLKVSCPASNLQHLQGCRLRIGLSLGHGVRVSG